MRANRRRDSKPELAVRRILHGMGLRYRVDFRIDDGCPRPVRPDIVFTRQRVAVFIDGCFWHGCPEHGRRTGGDNSHYWTPKIARNRQRDAEQAQRLTDAGWRVARFWEHESPSQICAAIVAMLAQA